MIIRTSIVIGGAALVVGASSAAGQGQPERQIVVSEAAMKSMAAQKPKSKTPLTARVGMVRQSSVAPAKPGHGTPTSVREIKPTKN